MKRIFFLLYVIVFISCAEEKTYKLTTYVVPLNSGEIIPKSGMLVVWPGTLYHSVPPTDGKRTVLAMNLLVKNE